MSPTPVHLKASVTVLVRPGELLELMPAPDGWRLYAQTPKTKTWREIAREQRKRSAKGGK